MKITGILSISNGTGLKYPFPVVVDNLHRFCDDVIVGVDPNFPDDLDRIARLNLPNVGVVDSPWDLTSIDAGIEIALQMEKLVKLAHQRGSDWVVVLQADELFHEKDFEILRLFMERRTDVNGFRMKRLYFWRDLDTIRVDWCADLVRIFRPNTYSFMADGTDKAGMYSGPIITGTEVYLPYYLYHYSRVDAPEVISRRVRNLDGFFHPEEKLIDVTDLPPYDFVPRIHDNFAKRGFPEEVKGEFNFFRGSHPRGIREWYSNG